MLGGSGHLDGTTHTPVARAAPTCAVEGVSAGLVEDERGRHPRTRRDLDLGGFVAPYGKAVDDIIRGQTKLQRVADLLAASALRMKANQRFVVEV